MNNLFRARNERDRASAPNRVEILRYRFPDKRECSVCRRAMRQGVLITRCDIPYWIGLCLECAELVAEAAE